MREKGFTIIENIVGIVIISILLVIGSTMIINLIQVERKESLNVFKGDSIDNFFLDLEMWLSKENFDGLTVIGESEIVMHYTEHNFCKRLRFIEGNKIVMETIKICSGEESDRFLINDRKVMLEQVDDLKVIRKGNLYYLQINMDFGDELIKCL